MVNPPVTMHDLRPSKMPEIETAFVNWEIPATLARIKRGLVTFLLVRSNRGGCGRDVFRTSFR